MLRTTLAGIVLTTCMSTLAAAPIDPAHVADDAKWTVHFDVQAMRNTTIAEYLNEARLQRKDIRTRMDKFKDQFGIDFREDVHSLTMYGTKFERHQGVAVMLADFNRDRVISLLEEQPGYEKSEYEGHTLHTWDVEKDKVTRREARRGPEREARRDRFDRREQRRARTRERRRERPDTMTAVFRNEEMVIFGADSENVKKALDVVEGRAESLEGTDSPLIADIPEGTVIYGTAIDLDQVERERRFGFLSRAKKACFAIGEHEGETFFKTDVRADAEQIARNLVNLMEGMDRFEARRAEVRRAFRNGMRGMRIQFEDERITIEFQTRPDADEVEDIDGVELGPEERRRDNDNDNNGRRGI